MERWLSGLKRTLGKCVYPLGIVGSNPTLSASFKDLNFYKLYLGYEN